MTDSPDSPLTPGGGTVRTLVWDDENRLLKTTDKSGTNENITSYSYDAAGMRALKKGKYGTVQYVSDNYTVRNKDLISKHVFAGNTRLVSKTVMQEEKSGKMTTTEQGAYYYHPDHLGSSSVVTDKAGKFYEQIEYFPYGETWINNKANSEQTSSPYKFTAKEYDEETGLYYYGARYYDAKLSRWCSADPAIEDYLPSGDEEYDAYLPGIGGVFNSINLDAYHYAGDNPIKLIDPNGREQKRNKDSWSWLILNYFTGGLWEKSTGQYANDSAAAGTGFSDEMLRATADFTIAGDIKVLATGTNFRGEKQNGAAFLLAALPFIGKTKYLGKIANVSVWVNEVKASRMLVGRADKIAVIGRNMDDRVKPFAKAIGAEYFIPSKKALKAFDAGDSSLLMKENTEWANKIKQEGYTIYDVGLDPNWVKQGSFEKGDYYEMETKVIFGDK